MLFGLIWILGELLFGFTVEAIKAFLFYYIVPFSVLLFIPLKSEYLRRVLFVIAFIVSLSCIIEFIVLNIYPGYPQGLYIMSKYLSGMVRDTGEVFFSRKGLLYCANGITFWKHDSGNILAMMFVYIGGYAIHYKKGLPIYLFVFFVFIGLLCTISIANIIASLVGMTFLLLMTAKARFGRVIFSIIMMLVVFYYLQAEFEIFAQVAPDFDPDGSAMETLTSLGNSSFSHKLVSILFGHERLSGFSDLGEFTEVALLKMLTQMGIITFSVFMFVTGFPLYLFLSSNKYLRIKMIVPAITVFTGLLTLWHYGSLYRSTSIFLFFAFSSIILKKYVSVDCVNIKNQNTFSLKI